MGICYNEDKSTYTITAVDNIIEAIVTNKGHVAAKWVDDILHINHCHLSDLIIGFDLEWCPNTLYGTSRENPVALLQLCVGHRCLIFQLLYCDFIPDKLCDFLKDYRHRFVGVGIKEDAEKLERGYGTEVAHLVDLRHLAAEHMVRPEMRRWGLNNLAREVMGMQMDKPKRVTLSNWGKYILSNEQIEYAAVDAFVSFEIGRRIYAGEFREIQGRMALWFEVIGFLLICFLLVKMIK